MQAATSYHIKLLLAGFMYQAAAAFWGQDPGCPGLDCLGRVSLPGAGGILQLPLTADRMPFPTWWVLLGICTGVPGLQAAASDFPPPCASPIYCTGELLRQVQMNKLFSDDKHFVDMPLRGSPETVLQDFQQLVNAAPGGAVSKQQLAAFVQAHFSPPGQELEPWEPSDWTQRLPSAALPLSLLLFLAPSAEARQALWAELKGAAESGWDFSSRWFLPGPPPVEATLQDTQASAVVPVDLNALLCRVEALLAAFCDAGAGPSPAERFRAAHRRRVAAVRAVLWNEEAGVWLDYNLARRRHNRAFYPSNLTPLWAECGLEGADVEKALRYLESSTALSYAHGLPTSLARTGQQWDLPNAWAPLQHMVIAGLARSSSSQARELAFTLAQNWVRMNLAVYGTYRAMFEKYDVEGDGNPGAGGEYVVQEGFGWTNGVALQLLDLFGDRLTAAGPALPCSGAWVGACLILLLALGPL
ncbi:PREDICTED: trehalase [Gekko japonicus]|uniref:Trehalase n=1 Tax=Gekko japonicus TaxID=146911 RepID=A0ABM1LC32_GEKJA|nr:PREDICTED: trehalase [Gekko japonicus]